MNKFPEWFLRANPESFISSKEIAEVLKKDFLWVSRRIPNPSSLTKGYSLYLPVPAKIKKRFSLRKRMNKTYLWKVADIKKWINENLIVLNLENANDQK